MKYVPMGTAFAACLFASRISEMVQRENMNPGKHNPERMIVFHCFTENIICSMPVTNPFTIDIRMNRKMRAVRNHPRWAGDRNPAIAIISVITTIRYSCVPVPMRAAKRLG
eukprot:gene5406-biopygen5341